MSYVDPLKVMRNAATLSHSIWIPAFAGMSGVGGCQAARASSIRNQGSKLGMVVITLMGSSSRSSSRVTA